MSIADWIADAIVGLGSVVPGAVQEVGRGATFSHKTIAVDDHHDRAIKALRDSGIDAWGGHPVRNGSARGELDVRKEDYERAKKVLNRKGFGCW